MHSRHILTMAYQGNTPAPHLTISTPLISQKALSFHPSPPLSGTPTNPRICRPAVPTTPNVQQHRHARTWQPWLARCDQAVSTAESSAPRGVQHRGELPPPAPRPPPNCAPPGPGSVRPLPWGTFGPGPGYPYPQVRAFPPRPVRVCVRALPFVPLPCPSRCPPTCRRSGRSDLPAVSHGSGIGEARAAPRTPAPSSSGRRCPE